MMMTMGCYGGFLGLPEAVENGEKILNKIKGVPIMRRTQLVTHGAQYCLWWGHKEENNHTERYRAEARRLLEDERFTFHQSIQAKDPIGNMDLYCELLLMFETPEITSHEYDALRRIYNTLQCTDQYKLHLKMMMIFCCR